MEEDDAVGSVVDFSAQKSLGSCPNCGGSVFEHGKNFVCEKSVVFGEVVQASCDFKLQQTILTRPISREQCGKLLVSGKTDFLKGFVSMRTNKSFRARLVWEAENGKINFEFPVQQKRATPKPVKAAKVSKPAKPKSPDALQIVANRFFAKHQSASAEFLDDLFILGNSLVELAEAGDSSSPIVKALLTVEQSIMHRFLERADCPDWLGVWVAKHGRKEQQIAYLFRPTLDEEIEIADRIGSRPPEIKRLFWSSKASAVIDTLLAYDDEMYLTWARDIGFDGEIKVPNLEPENDDEYVPTHRGQIIDWLEKVLDPVTDALWKEHVPKTGACTVLQGELARYIGRLEHEYWKNGMMNMGNGFYDRMVDKIKETILSNKSFSPLVKKVLAMDASVVKGARYGQLGNLTLFQESNVEISLGRLKNVVAAWCLKNREPIPYIPNALD